MLATSDPAFGSDMANAPRYSAPGDPRHDVGTPFLAHRLHPDHAVTARDQAADTHPRPRKLFRYEAIFESTKSQATIFLGNDDTEITQFSHFRDQFVRDHALLGIQLVGERENLLHHKIARAFLNHQALFRHPAHFATPATIVRPGGH